MTRTIACLVAASTFLVHAAAAAQSASVSLAASSTSPAPGDTITVTVEAQFNTAGAAAGLFGSAGLYGFGGEVAASGSASLGSVAAAPLLDPALGFAPVVELPVAADRYVLAAAGRGFAGGLPGPSQMLATFDVTIDPAAGDGDVLVLAFEGAVVLVLGDALVTYATDPGPNQQSLASTELVISVAAGRLCADQNADGLVTPADFNAWIFNFNTGDARADANQDGIVSPADLNAWILAFNLGASGPACSP
jgi:hypothetical protein